MLDKMENPAGLARAHRVDVIMLAGKDDIDDTSAYTAELQVRRLLARYAISLPVALVMAELAFASGREA